MIPPPDFFLGAKELAWTAAEPRRWFVSYSTVRRRLRDEAGVRKKRPSLPRAAGPVALDSSGFTILNRFASWEASGITPEQYAEDAEFFAQANEGLLEFAVPQDWMCEDFMIAKTGAATPRGSWRSRREAIRAHQRRTTESFFRLRELAPSVPWGVPLQGYFLDEYLEHVEDYAAAGIDLEAAPRVVVGSMCKRQAMPEAARIAAGIWARVPRSVLHLLGFKTAGMPIVRRALDARARETGADPAAVRFSCDSMAWAMAALKRWYVHHGCRHGKSVPRKPLWGRSEYGNCAGCLRWALWWGEEAERAAAGLPRRAAPGIEHARGARPNFERSLF